MKRESPKYDKKMVVNNIEMSVALAISKEEQTQGLMEISTLPDNAGMLFIFDQEGGWGFWMKNTLIPLDMIWINKSFEIVDIQTAPPCPPEEKDCPAYRPTVPAKYVLEVNGDGPKETMSQWEIKLTLIEFYRTLAFNTGLLAKLQNQILRFEL